jgi:hypothetical protein
MSIGVFMIPSIRKMARKADNMHPTQQLSRSLLMAPGVGLEQSDCISSQASRGACMQSYRGDCTVVLFDALSSCNLYTPDSLELGAHRILPALCTCKASIMRRRHRLPQRPQAQSIRKLLAKCWSVIESAMSWNDPTGRTTLKLAASKSRAGSHGFSTNDKRVGLSMVRWSNDPCNRGIYGVRTLWALKISFRRQD